MNARIIAEIPEKINATAVITTREIPAKTGLRIRITDPIRPRKLISARFCIANGWIDRDPFLNYSSTFNEVTRVFLNEEEIEKLFNKDFKNERLSQVRYIFLFSCFTGLAYIDTQKLTNDNVSIGLDGNKWIYTKRQKTKTTSNIPVLPQAEQIIDKYRNHPSCLNSGKLLPVLSNQKMNAYLKEIADLCGINKELTYHIISHAILLLQL